MKNSIEKHDILLENIKKYLKEAEGLKVECEDHWGAEDLVYRYYHHSFKVYQLQWYTEQVLKLIEKINPDGCELNSTFMRIILNGTNKKWEHGDNMRWDYETLPILEAYFHAKYFLDMMIKYGNELNKAPDALPSGWASVLYLYNLR